MTSSFKKNREVASNSMAYIWFQHSFFPVSWSLQVGSNHKPLAGAIPRPPWLCVDQRAAVADANDDDLLDVPFVGGRKGRGDRGGASGRSGGAPRGAPKGGETQPSQKYGTPIPFPNPVRVTGGYGGEVGT